MSDIAAEVCNAHRNRPEWTDDTLAFVFGLKPRTVRLILAGQQLPKDRGKW